MSGEWQCGGCGAEKDAFDFPHPSESGWVEYDGGYVCADCATLFAAAPALLAVCKFALGVDSLAHVRRMIVDAVAKAAPRTTKHEQRRTRPNPKS
jgi:hypothetical protein